MVLEADARAGVLIGEARCGSLFGTGWHLWVLAGTSGGPGDRTGPAAPPCRLSHASKQALPLAIASLGTLGCRVVFTRPQPTLHNDQSLF